MNHSRKAKKFTVPEIVKTVTNPQGLQK